MIQVSGFKFVRMAAALLAASTVMAAPAVAQDTAKQISFGKGGVDLSGRDTSVKPGDDFQRYTSGKWLDANPIPADQVTNGTFFDTYNNHHDRLRDVTLGAHQARPR